jgi:hypothetical protein
MNAPSFLAGSTAPAAPAASILRKSLLLAMIIFLSGIEVRFRTGYGRMTV